MARYEIVGQSPKANGTLELDVYVYPTNPLYSPGHITVTIDAEEVNACAVMTPAERNARMKELFESDERIMGICDSEEASALLDEWYTFPLSITL